MRLSIDIDDVLADFTRSFFRKLGIDSAAIQHEWAHPRDYWYERLIPQIGTPEESFQAVFTPIKKDNDFWLNVAPMETVVPKSAEFYLTSRECPDEVTKEWLKKNGFPDLPVINALKDGRPKHVIAKVHGMTGHVDDKAETFVECFEYGLSESFLVSRPWNIHVVTDRKVTGLSQIEWWEKDLA